MPYLANPLSRKNLRKKLRRTQTFAECILWSCLRAKRFKGLKFYRQYGIERYILDFYCHDLLLGIELDGGYHESPKQIKYDKYRQELIESKGIKIIRFKNEQILENINEVLEELDTITDKLKDDGQDYVNSLQPPS